MARAVVTCAAVTWQLPGTQRGPRPECVSHAACLGSCVAEETQTIPVVPESWKRTALDFLKKHVSVVLQLTSFASRQEETTWRRPAGQDSQRRRSHLDASMLCAQHTCADGQAARPAVREEAASEHSAFCCLPTDCEVPTRPVRPAVASGKAPLGSSTGR